MKILRCIAGLLFLCSFFFFPSCKPSTPTPVIGDWRRAAPFKGVPVSGAFCFTIGDKAYVGLGFDGIKYQDSSYSYDVKTKFWQGIAAFPGWPREQAVAFAINGKGYVGTGYNRDSLVVALKDFWEYDPATNAWTQLNDFPGGARYNAVGFDDGTFGYVGTGYNTYYYGDFWKYNADTDTWTEIPSYGGDKRSQAMTMTVSGKTYLFGGLNNGSFTTDIWEFNPVTQTWADRTPLTTDAQYNNFRSMVNRYDGGTFSLNNMGYVACGSNGQFLNTVYQYDPVGNTYTLMTPFERSARSQCVGFTIGNEVDGYHGFIATGLLGTTRLDDMMEFFPTEVYVLNN